MESKTDIALIKKDIKYLIASVDDIKNTLNCTDKKYVQKIEFELVNKEQNKRIGQLEKLVFSAIGLALITLGKAILDLVVNVKAGN